MVVVVVDFVDFHCCCWFFIAGCYWVVVIVVTKNLFCIITPMVYFLTLIYF